MSITYIKFMAPTMKDAGRVGRMARRIHGEDLTIPLLYGKIEPDPVHGYINRIKPDGSKVRSDWHVATRNPNLAGDKYAWERAVYLYDTKPQLIAWLISWLDYWRTRHGKRVPLPETQKHTDQT